MRMLKEYADYLLKVKALDDADYKRKQEQEQKEEDLIKKLAEFQKKGLQANEGLMKNTFDWQTKRLDTAKKAVEDNANDQIKVVQEKIFLCIKGAMMLSQYRMLT